MLNDKTTGEINNWLKLFQVEKAIPPKTSTAAPKVLCYILELQDKQAIITIGVSKYKKNRQLSKPSGANISRLLASKPGYLSMADLAALAMLSDGYRHNAEPIVLPAIAQSRELLETLISTGRFFLNSFENLPLTSGGVFEPKLEWLIDLNGNQSLGTKQPGLELFVLDVPMYCDLQNNTIGLINNSLEPNLLKNLLQAPPISPNQIAIVHKKLKTVNKALLPQVIKNIEQRRPAPKIFLQLGGIYGLYFIIDVPRDLGAAHLCFSYEELIVNSKSQKTSFFRQQDGVVSEIHRDLAAEEKLVEKLKQLTKMLTMDEIRAHHHFFLRTEKIDSGLYTIFDVQKPNFTNIKEQWQDCIKIIKSQGWDVDIDDSFPYLIEHSVEDWFASVEEDPDNDWFSINLGIKVNGEKVDLLPLLCEIIKNNDVAKINNSKQNEVTFSLGDGTVVSIDTQRIKMMLSFVKELYNRVSGGKLQLSKEDAANFIEFNAASAALGLRWMGEGKLKKIGEKFKNFKGIEAAIIPDAFAAVLRPYQHEGVNWLQFLREYNLAGILADDMGLGKTVQTLAHISIEKAADRMQNKPCLVIAPTSVLPNWLMEAKRFAPHLKVIALRAGMDRKNLIENLHTSDIILSTYALVLRDKEDLLKHNFHTIILDEAQFIKNSKAKITQVVNQLQADHRLCLTGTPLENHLGELWSLFNFLMPGFLGVEKTFNTFYRQPIEKNQDTTMRQALMRRIQPFMLRRTKDKVATELPNKTEIIQMCELDSVQADLYETIRVSMHSKVTQEISSKGLARSHIILLDALLKLRQVCCHPQLLKIDSAKDITISAKLEQLMSMVPEMLEEGRKIVLFSQFTSMIAIIEDAFNLAKIGYVKIVGNTKDRQKPIEDFQQGKVSIILISLKAGGTGINLTAADTVIHYDPWWNPAVEQQATDRVYRIGQNKPVFVYKMLTTGTVEEKILAMQQKKAKLAASMFDDETQIGNWLQESDINNLFAPFN